MITRKNFQLQVCNGPSKVGLITSFVTAKTKAPNQPFRVTFEVMPGQEVPQLISAGKGYKFQAVLNSISHEDGSGESFCIGGTLYDNHNGELKTFVQHPFTGYYHAGGREGYLNFSCDYADDGRNGR